MEWLWRSLRCLLWEQLANGQQNSVEASGEAASGGSGRDCGSKMTGFESRRGLVNGLLVTRKPWVMASWEIVRERLS